MTCLGCEQGPTHRHMPAEDGPRETCCAHSCKEGGLHATITYQQVGFRTWRIDIDGERADYTTGEADAQHRAEAIAKVIRNDASWFGNVVDVAVIKG